jgi:mRNA interferase RelE/StbE
VSYEVSWEIQALDQAAGFLRDDPSGVAALWDSVSRLADEPRPLESFPYGCCASFLMETQRHRF